jgi:lactoylglutathione lyase
MQYGSTVLFVDDVPTVMAFYEKAFGFETRFFDDDYEFGEMNAGGAVIGFGSHKTGERMIPGTYPRPGRGHPEGVEIAFFVDDVPAAFNRAVTAGAHPLRAPAAMPWGQTVAYVRSIEGTVIGLCTPIEKG